MENVDGAGETQLDTACDTTPWAGIGNTRIQKSGEGTNARLAQNQFRSQIRLEDIARSEAYSIHNIF
jgi:hypothetical protein